MSSYVRGSEILSLISISRGRMISPDRSRDGMGMPKGCHSFWTFITNILKVNRSRFITGRGRVHGMSCGRLSQVGDEIGRSPADSTDLVRGKHCRYSSAVKSGLLNVAREVVMVGL